MKILVTGATGFIGTCLIRRLIPKGYRLRCLVRKTSRTRALAEREIELFIGDVTDKDTLIKAMTGCNRVLNLANVYSFWERDPRIYYEVNVEGTRKVMEAALEMGIDKVVHVSTAGIFGRPSEIPFSEESPVGPKRFSEYFRTKYEGDLIAWKLYKERHLPLVMIYPVAVLGPGDTKATGQYIARLINKRLPATVFENKRFTFVHVEDVAEAIIKAAEKENNFGEKYIIGNQCLTFGEINRMVSEIAGVALPGIRMPDFLTMINARLLTILANIIKKPPLWGMATDQMRVMKAEFVADGSKAEKELGITYTPIRNAIEETIISIRKNT